MNSAAGSFGLTFGLAFAGANMLATLSIAFTELAKASDVLPAADQQRVADVLEDEAQVMSNTQLEDLLADQPETIQDEIVRINTDARPIALQVALAIPILAGPIRPADRRISHQGSPALRWALVEAAQHAARGGGPLRETHERIAKRRGNQVAKVAVARKILTLCFFGLRDGEIRCLAPRARARTSRPTAVTA